MVPVIWVKDTWNEVSIIDFWVKYMHDRTEK